MRTLIKLLGLLLTIILLMYVYSITFHASQGTYYPTMQSENYKLDVIQIE
jgi:YbbR domain-containing protein